MRRPEKVIGLVLLALVVSVVAWAVYTENPYTAGETAGTEVSSTYEGRHVTIIESELVHPTQSDGFANKGDPVTFGNRGVGVCLISAPSASHYVSIDTEGIWNLSVTPVAAMTIGDCVYASTAPVVLSDTKTGQVFGLVLNDIATTGSASVVAVKVHMGFPDD